jgi:hypothetical protein
LLSIEGGEVKGREKKGVEGIKEKEEEELS